MVEVSVLDEVSNSEIGLVLFSGVFYLVLIEK